MTTQTKAVPRGADAGKEIEPRPAPERGLQELEALVDKYAVAVLETQGRFQRALTLAEGIQALRAAVRPLIGRIMPIQNSPLGFLTDKKDGGYPEAVVMECLIEATLRGVYPVSNEFNIIAGRCYVTKAGYARLVRELPGLTDLKLVPGVPRMSAGGAVVPFRAGWRLNGRADAIEREIPVRLNTGMGVDGAIGKATRKMLASVYAQVTGSEQTDGEVGDAELEPPSRTQQLQDELKAKGRAGGNGGPAANADQLSRIGVVSRQLDLSAEEFTALSLQCGNAKPALLTPEQADGLLVRLEAMARDAHEKEAAERQAVKNEG